MGMPLRQSLRVGGYVLRNKLAGRAKYPLIVELEPLYACNLACAGCGKIQHPADVLKQRMPVEQAVAAIEECGAPMVSIAGGEPLMHPQIGELVDRLIKMKRYVFLCTNAALIPKKIDRFTPSRSSRGRCTSTGCGSGTTRPSARRACSTRRSRRSGCARSAGSGSRRTRPCSTPTPRRP